MPGDRKNLSQAEQDKLFSIIKSYPIVNDKRRRKAVQEAKNRAWIDICKKFNENLPEEYQRNIDQLIKNLYNSRSHSNRSNSTNKDPNEQNSLAVDDTDASDSCLSQVENNIRASNSSSEPSLIEPKKTYSVKTSTFTFKVPKFQKKVENAPILSSTSQEKEEAHFEKFDYNDEITKEDSNFTDLQLPLSSTLDAKKNVLFADSQPSLSLILDTRKNDDFKEIKTSANDSDYFFNGILDGSSDNDYDLVPNTIDSCGIVTSTPSVKNIEETEEVSFDLDMKALPTLIEPCKSGLSTQTAEVTEFVPPKVIAPPKKIDVETQTSETKTHELIVPSSIKKCNSSDTPKTSKKRTRTVSQQVNFFKKKCFSRENDLAAMERKILYYKEKTARTEWRYSQLKLKILRSEYQQPLKPKQEPQDKKL